MRPFQKPQVKICCIASIEEARLAINYGASAVGLVSHMPSGPGVISEKKIREIAAAVPPMISTFLLTSSQDVRAIVEQQRRCGVDTIQLCDRVRIGDYSELRKNLPGIRIIQVVHVSGQESLDETCSVAPHVHGILLDSGNQQLAVKQLGGTGRTHDWRISRQIRDSVEVPVILAGGLTPENVLHAIHQVQPFAVDVCSGVRTQGKLDESKLSAFMNEVNTSDFSF